MAAGCTRREIVLEVIKAYHVTEKTAYSYYLIVEAEWQDEVKHKRSFYRKKALKKLEQFQKAALSSGKLGAGVQAVREECRLLGLYEPDEVIVHHTDVHPTESMTTAQLRSYITEKREKREALLSQVLNPSPPSTSVN